MNIKIQNVCKKYQNTDVLNDISLTIHEHDFLIIYGESGCGKTTLLQIIAGLSPASKGHIFYDDIEMNNENRQMLSDQISYVFQDHRLLEEFTVLENILSGINFTNQELDQEWLDSLCHELQIQELLNRKVNQISIGQRQRVAIARALIKKPEVLFLDEPTGNLDDENTLSLLEFLKTIHEKTSITILMVTHERFLRKYGNRIVRIQNYYLIEEENKVHPYFIDKETKIIQVRLQCLSIFKVVKKYMLYHKIYYLFISLCISICCVSFFLSINVGHHFEEYLYKMASTHEESRFIDLISQEENGKISGDDLNEIAKLNHVKTIDYDLHLSYAYERTFDDEIMVLYKNRKLSDSIKLIDFFKFKEQSTLVEGTLDVKGNEIVVDESVVDDLKIDHPIGKTITLRIPIAIYFEKQNLSENIYNDTESFEKYVPVNENKMIDFKIVGVMNTDYEENYTMIHDLKYMENIVKDNAAKVLGDNQFSAFSTSRAQVEIDSVDSLKSVMSQIEDNYDIQCSSQVVRIMESIENLHKIQSIYIIVNIFILISLISVVFVIVVMNFSTKQKFNAILQFLGASSQELIHLLVTESIIIFCLVSFMSVVFTKAGLPMLNQVISKTNPIVEVTQFAVGTSLELFDLNGMQIVLSLSLGIVLILVIQLFFFMKNKKKTMIEILEWEVR